MTGPRKYESGSQKRKAKERRDMLIQSFAGSMDRYVKRKPNQSENENVNVNVNACNIKRQINNNGMIFSLILKRSLIVFVASRTK